MDLKTFAVYQKLISNSTLLEYIVNNEDIPVNVVEDNMKELLEPLQHSESEALVNDYREHLRNTVKTSFSKKEDNVFDVNGHIDDPVIESIELLHGVDREDVVRDVVSSVMGDLNSDRHVEIENVLLSEEADDFLRMATKPLFSSDISQTIDVEPDEAIDHLLDEVLSSEDIVKDDAVEEDVVQDIELEEEEVVHDIDPSDLEDIESLEVPLRDLDVTSHYDDDVIDETVEDVIEEAVEDTIEDVPVEDIIDDVPVEDTYEEPYEEEAYEAPAEQEEIQAHAFKQAYDFLIGQLHEKGLVDKLPGLHVPQV